MTHQSREAMLHYLRIAVTALSLTACVLLIGLWVRSYWYCDTIYRADASRNFIAVKSNYGTLTFVRVNVMVGGDWAIHFASRPSNKTKQAFLWDDNGTLGGIVVPFWGIVPPLAMLAIVMGIPWIHWSKRFSLRTLLIATTLVAVGLGIVVWSM